MATNQLAHPFTRVELPIPPSQFWENIPVREVTDEIDSRFLHLRDEEEIVNLSVGRYFRVETRVKSYFNGDILVPSFITSIWDARAPVEEHRPLDDQYCLTYYPSPDSQTAMLTHHAALTALSLTYRM